MGFTALTQASIVNRIIVQSSQSTCVPTTVMNASRLQAEQSREAECGGDLKIFSLNL